MELLTPKQAPNNIIKGDFSMRSVKKMLLGIALLIISIIGLVLWLAGTVIGAVTFFATLIIGILFIVDGFLSIDKE